MRVERLRNIRWSLSSQDARRACKAGAKRFYLATIRPRCGRPQSTWKASQCGPLWGIHNPRIGHDNVGGRIPVAIFIEPGVKTVAVVHIRLRELDRTVCSKLQMIEADFGHFLVGLHLLHRQTAGAHADDLLVADISSNGVAAYLADFMLAVLVQFRSE